MEKFEFKYVPDHPKAAEGLPNPLVAPYAMCFDSSAMLVQDYFQFPEGTPLIAAKATYANVLSSFINEYKHNVGKLFMAGEMAGKKLSKPPILPVQMCQEATARAEMIYERSRDRLMQWDGNGELHCMLPYCVIATQKVDDSNEIVDFKKSSMNVHAMIWVLRFHD